MKAIGQIEIEEGLTLKNPTLSIKMVTYNWDNYSVHIECIFKEENALYEHSRIFTYSTEGSGELTSGDIIELIKNDPILNVFE